MGPLPLRCVSGTRRRIDALTDGFSSGGIRRTGLGAQSSSCAITSRLRRRTRWWGSMTSCGWHGWPARNGRANLPRPARLPLVADQVSPAVTLAAMARQVFSLLPAHHPSIGAHRRPERVGSAFSHHLVQSPNGPLRATTRVRGHLIALSCAVWGVSGWFPGEGNTAERLARAGGPF